MFRCAEERKQGMTLGVISGGAQGWWQSQSCTKRPYPRGRGNPRKKRLGEGGVWWQIREGLATAISPAPYRSSP